MKVYKRPSTLSKVGAAIGIGLMSGLAGTAMMSLSQSIEMKITGRKPSQTPANAVREVFDIKPVSEDKSTEVSNEIHWLYGTSLGLIRGALSLLGLQGFKASIIHFATVWGGEMIVLPFLKVAPPVTKQKPKDICLEGLHVMIYAFTTGLIFDAINKNKKGRVAPEDGRTKRRQFEIHPKQPVGKANQSAHH